MDRPYITNDQGSIPKVAVEWKPEGRRKRGRLRMTWRRTVEAEAAAMGHSRGTLRTLAQDRLRWREFVAALVVYDKKGSKSVSTAISQIQYSVRFIIFVSLQYSARYTLVV